MITKGDWQTILKSLSALYLGLMGWASAVIASPSGPVTSAEWVALATVVGVSIGVYAVPNKPPAPPTG